MDSGLFDVKITETAWEQMLEHTRFLANVSADAAEQLAGDFVKCADSLSEMPERCPWLIHETIPFQKYRKLMFGKNYMVLFQIRGRTVYITAAIDCRQDYSWLL